LLNYAEKTEYTTPNLVDHSRLLNFNAMNNAAAAKTVSMAVLFGAKEQTP
jgi:hypothetical protein